MLGAAALSTGGTETVVVSDMHQGRPEAGPSCTAAVEVRGTDPGADRTPSWAWRRGLHVGTPGLPLVLWA